MFNAVMLISFNLVKGASVPDFFLASEKVHREFMSKQKGFISWNQLTEGEVWVDLLTWESMDDAKNAMEASSTVASVVEFCSFLDQESVKHHLYSVVKCY